MPKLQEIKDLMDDLSRLQIKKGILDDFKETLFVEFCQLFGMRYVDERELFEHMCCYWEIDMFLRGTIGGYPENEGVILILTRLNIQHGLIVRVHLNA